MFRLVILLVSASLFAETIDTFYGPIEVEEPVLLELIKSPPLQRLKAIHQYGVAYYTTHHEEYNRFDHSIGVFAILKVKGASLKEQMSGLLHDVSHTVFSHVGDWVFGKEYQENDYQTTIYKIYLATSGIEETLNKYGYTVEDVLPKGKEFIMLEQPLPNMSADRLDYNIQGAYFQDFLTKEEALELFADFHFEDGRWIATRKDLLAQLAHFSIFMTQTCWGSAINHFTSRCLADAMLEGVKMGLISWKELHFGTDQEVWDKLQSAANPFIQEQMHMLFHPHDYFRTVDPAKATHFVKFRCRGIDPWVKQNGEIVRLYSIDPELEKEFQALKETSLKGWPILIQENSLLRSS